MKKPHGILGRAAVAGGLTLLGAALALAAQDDGERGGLPLGLEHADYEPVVDSKPQVELGRRLFFDPLISETRDVSCASCHDPEHGFASDTPLSIGVHDRETTRNAPTLYNRALGTSFMWDGRASTLEEQVLLPIVNELEMNLTLDDAVARLAAHGEYPALFQGAFGEGPSADHLAAALSAFVRTLLYGDSPLDRFRTGDFEALTQEERSGLWLFESRGRCWRCHSGSNFSDEGFHDTGIGVVDGTPEDGRFAVTGDEADRGRFKTPTLRGLTETGPYMHDGSLPTLTDVVEFYRRGGNANPNLDGFMQPIEMTDREAAQLAAFLAAISHRQSAEIEASDGR